MARDATKAFPPPRRVSPDRRSGSEQWAQVPTGSHGRSGQMTMVQGVRDHAEPVRPVGAPSPTRTATLNGHDLSYVDAGDGSPALFIHGLLGSHESWTGVVDRLDPGHRSVVPDLFGHGGSAKPLGDYSPGSHAAILRDLLDVLEIDRVTLIGHSLGG